MFGDGLSGTSRSQPTTVTGINDADEVSVGIFHACAKHVGGNLSCWGNNFFGQLGEGSNSPSLLPASVTGLSNIQEVVVGGGTTCALVTSGPTYCWGLNASGQLGNNSFTDSALPTPIFDYGGSLRFSFLTAGNFHFCGVNTPGEIVGCWGANDLGQRGNPNTTGQIPTGVPGIAAGTVKSIDASYANTCAVLFDGDALCWGRNDLGQLGNGTTTGEPYSVGPPNYAPVTVLREGDAFQRCIAYQEDQTGGPGCSTAQEINLSVVQGNLVQRAYTGGSNPNATTISLGSIVSPTAPTALNATLNPITVSDNRGGTFGWSLTAVLSNFSGATGNTINKSRVSLTADCSPATAGTAWDYSAVGQTAVSGYDSFYAASGATGGGSQSLGSAVNLCTKDGTINAMTGSTGGIYNATAGVTLLVPAFQASDSYVAVLTVTLA